MKKLGLIFVGLMFSGCGGGGGDAFKANYSTLKVFSDGSGVAQGKGNDGSRALILIPEVTNIVTEANKNSGDSDLDLEMTDFPIVGSTATSTIRQGAVTAEGLTQNILIYHMDDENGMSLITIPQYGIKYFLVSGDEFTGNLSGTFSFSGDQILEGWQVGNFREIGSVTIDADFDNNVFTYNGTTESSSLIGVGVLESDTARFTDVDATLTVSGRSYEATIHGLINGSSGKNTTGVFHTNDSTPDYVGAFSAKK